MSDSQSAAGKDRAAATSRLNLCADERNQVTKKVGLLMPAFVGEEGLGRYLDLHAHYLALINAKFGKKDLEYYEYVAGLATHTSTIPRAFKAGTAYRCVCVCACVRLRVRLCVRV